MWAALTLDQLKTGLKTLVHWKAFSSVFIWNDRVLGGPTGGGPVTGADAVLTDGVELTHAGVLRAHVHGLGQEELPVRPQAQE